MSDTILLTAASGIVGRAILKKLAGLKQTVKVVIRNRDDWAELKELGASGFAIGDLLDTDFVESAVMGCDKILHSGPFMHPEEKQMADNLVAAAKQHHVSHFIYCSVLQPLRKSLCVHGAKLEIEEMIIESGLAYSILQPAVYMQYLLPAWEQVLETGVHALTMSTSEHFSLVDMYDVAEAAAIVAAEGGHEYARYELAGLQGLNQMDVAAIISEVVGCNIEAKPLPLDVFERDVLKRGLSPHHEKQLLAMHEYYGKYGLVGNPNVLAWILGRMPCSFQQFVERLWAGQNT